MSVDGIYSGKQKILGGSGEFPLPVAFNRSGRVYKSTGSMIRATGNYAVGQICEISRSGHPPLMAEVVGFEKGEALLTAYGSVNGVSYNSTIHSVMKEFEAPVGEGLCGRILNALGRPIDNGALPEKTRYFSCNRAPPDPMSRPPIDNCFPLGIRALDGLLTCGEGQRMGIFAAAGGGKSTLISTIVRNAGYDKCIIALIGERGREVREFIEGQLGKEGMERAVVIVATSDRPAIEQVKAAYVATSIAEFYRDCGDRVLLIMDSLTRFARAQRQIGLSAGEAPARRGFPTSVFELLPSLVERAGKTEVGSITALYTVLVEGDDMNEPVADEVRSLLDGHIILSRKLAAANHFPAIDVLASASRVLNNIASPEHLAAISKLRSLLAKSDEIELLLRLGEYEQGSDALADEAIQRKKDIDTFLRQDLLEKTEFEETLQLLKKVVGYA